MLALVLSGCAIKEEAPDPAPRGVVYYVDAESGNDAASGVAPGAAWKSLARANRQTLAPGDTLLLKRGGAWRERLRPLGSGTPARRIRVGAYGEGARPRIDGGQLQALLLENASHVTIENLELTNAKESGRDALWVRADPERGRHEGIEIVGCLAHHAGRSGIHVGDNKSAPFSAVAVRSCEASENQDSGIFLQGAYLGERMRSAAITGSAAHGNGWDGIKIFSAEDGLIERCSASGNGWKEDARVGIWCWDSRRVTIRRCESFANRTPGTQDGAGFDIDWGCSECVIEHCVSHDNEGAGYLFMGAGADGQTTKSVLRFNTSTNDGLKNAYGGIVCYGNLTDSQVHDNWIVFSGAADGAAIQFRGDAKAFYPSGVVCSKNSVRAAGGRALLRVPAEAAATCHFDENRYSADGEGLWIWNTKRHTDFETFRSATGQEAKGQFLAR